MFNPMIYTVTTWLDGKKIVQTVEADDEHGTVTPISHAIADTQERQLREHLVKLGWKEPEDK